MKTDECTTLPLALVYCLCLFLQQFPGVFKIQMMWPYLRNTCWLKILRAQEKRFNLCSTQLVYKAFNKSLRDSISKEIKHCFLSMASMHMRCLKRFEHSGHSLFLPYSLFHVTHLSPQICRRTTEPTPLMPGHRSGVIFAYFTFSLTESVISVWIRNPIFSVSQEKKIKHIFFICLHSSLTEQSRQC